MPLATEEILRYGSPTMHFRRTATRDLELRDTSIREGDKVVVWFVSANYDEGSSRTPNASTSRATRTRTWRSAAAGRTSAWVRTSPVSRSG